MDDKRIYLDGVYAVRKGRKKGGVLRLCIHSRNVAVSCSVCGSPCKLGATGENRRWRGVFNKRVCDGIWRLRLSCHEWTRHLWQLYRTKIGAKLTRRFVVLFAYHALDDGLIVCFC